MIRNGTGGETAFGVTTILHLCVQPNLTKSVAMTVRRKTTAIMKKNFRRYGYVMARKKN